jgi:hypothetical protein
MYEIHPCSSFNTVLYFPNLTLYTVDCERDFNPIYYGDDKPSQPSSKSSDINISAERTFTSPPIG